MNAIQTRLTDVILNTPKNTTYIGLLYDDDTNVIGLFYVMYDVMNNAYIISYNSYENKMSILELFKNRIICEVHKNTIKSSYVVDINILNLRVSDLVNLFKRLEHEYDITL